MQQLMKLRNVYAIVGVIVFILIFVVWKLNDYYKHERSALVQNQIHQQTLNLKTTISSQLSQLKNTISSYQGRIDESKINWVQLSPFYALVQLEISTQGNYKIKNLYVRSGTPAANWSADYVQKALAYSRFSNKDIHAQLFQNKQGGKFLSLIFSDAKIQNSRQAVALIGEASYFQKYFDALRNRRASNVLLTNDSIVVSHTQSDYIATRTQESQLSDKKYLIDKDQIRASNLSIISYSPKLVGKELIYIPMFVLFFVFGFALILIGLLFYALKPLRNEHRKGEIFKRVFEEVRKEPKSLPVDKAIAENRLDVTVAPIDRANFMLDEEEELTTVQLDKITPQDLVNKGLQTLSLAEVVDLALESLKEKISANGAAIEKQYGSYLKHKVDAERFQRAIENIISNSIEAQAKNITINIYDIQGLSNQVTNIDIIDDGHGVEPGITDKIWQPFYGTKDKRLHKGLGLPETVSIVQRYGGDIKIIENQPRGSIFRIEMDMEARGQTNEVTNISPPIEIIDQETEIDIDAILKLDDSDDEPTAVGENTTVAPMPSIDLDKEYKTKQYKIDQHIDILENPDIHFSKPEKKFDHLEVKVRKPQKL